MCRIHRTSDIKIDIGRLLKKHPADHRGAVLSVTPLFIRFVILDIILRIFEHPIDCDDALGHKIDTVDMRNRRDFRIDEIHFRAHRFAEITRGNRRRRSSAHDMSALLGEEKRHHFIAVVSVRRRTEQKIHRRPFSDPNRTHRGVVARLPVIQTVAFVEKNRGKRFRRKADVVKRLHIGDDVLSVPAEIERKSHTRMDAAVAHGDENIILLQLDSGTINRFSADIQFRFRNFNAVSVSEKNDQRIIILKNLGVFIVHNPNQRKGRIRNTAHGTHRKCGRNRRYAVLHGKAFGNHRGYDFGRQCRKYARLDAASETVRKHDHRRTVVLLDDIDMIAAQLFSVMVDASITDIRTKIIHPLSTPLIS